MKPLIVPKKQSVPPTTEPRLAYSVSETCRLIGCSERALRAWIKAGKFHAKKIGSRVFIPREALLNFLADSAISEK